MEKILKIFPIENVWAVMYCLWEKRVNAKIFNVQHVELDKQVTRFLIYVDSDDSERVKRCSNALGVSALSRSTERLGCAQDSQPLRVRTW